MIAKNKIHHTMTFTIKHAKIFTDAEKRQITGAKFKIDNLDDTTLRTFVNRTILGSAKNYDPKSFDICVTINENAPNLNERITAYISDNDGLKIPYDLFLDESEQKRINDVFYNQLPDIDLFKDKVIQCESCGTYLSVPTWKYKYCDKCRNSKALMKIKYRKRVSSSKQRLICNIESLLSKRKDDALKDEFYNNNNYFKAKLRGNLSPHDKNASLERVPMKNENDYIKWLRHFHLRLLNS